jgi:NAD(P)-dependent dehydrogenase (short-subunit alcohol dehydrogenase family)
MLKINFVAPAEICRQLLLKAINGNALHDIVFISSVSALRGVRGFSYYSASKAALDAFMRSLAMEYAPRVKVNSVLPGAIKTEMAEPSMLAESALTHPLGLGHPSDIADAVEFLLSAKARWITGQQLVVDGGWSCR